MVKANPRRCQPRSPSRTYLAMWCRKGGLGTVPGRLYYRDERWPDLRGTETTTSPPPWKKKKTKRSVEELLPFPARMTTQGWPNTRTRRRADEPLVLVPGEEGEEETADPAERGSSSIRIVGPPPWLQRPRNRTSRVCAVAWLLGSQSTRVGSSPTRLGQLECQQPCCLCSDLLLGFSFFRAEHNPICPSIN